MDYLPIGLVMVRGGCRPVVWLDQWSARPADRVRSCAMATKAELIAGETCGRGFLIYCLLQTGDCSHPR
jgi:hypothetical protein